jgi:hypothetical protein
MTNDQAPMTNHRKLHRIWSLGFGHWSFSFVSFVSFVIQNILLCALAPVREICLKPRDPQHNHLLPKILCSPSTAYGSSN